MDVIYKNVCGLDIHKKIIVACLRKILPDNTVKKEIRKYGTMTKDLLSLSDWMKKERVTHVAMESTGVYWKPIWNILEGEFDITLANAKSIKQVPGRKTDMKDSEWIAQLLQFGLLSKSFVPDREIRELRDLTRHRVKLIQQKDSVVNRIQKTLEDANIKLSSVATDIMGASGRDMINGLINGETDSEKLADLARRKLRGKIPELKVAMEGKVTEHHKFMLQMLMNQIDQIESWIRELDLRIEELMSPFEQEVSLLRTIPGIEKQNAQNILAEIGFDMDQFPSDAHLASWAGICPGNNESAGKHKSGKTTKGCKWLRRALAQSAMAAGRTKNTYLGEHYKRLARRRGSKKAAVAVGHTLLCIIYQMIKKKQVYNDLGVEHFIKLNPEQHKRYHIKKLEALGYDVELKPKDGKVA